MDLGFSEFVFLSRHLIDLAIVDHGHDGIFTPSVKPDIVSQIGGANDLITFTVDAVACGACTKLAFSERRLH